MTAILAATAQHGHLPVHVTTQMGEWIIIVAVVLVVVFIARALTS
jgi:hypothetical protein